MVAACSYEARTFGIHSAMPISRAFRLCPKGIYLRPEFKKYIQASRAIRTIFRSFADLVEPLAAIIHKFGVSVDFLRKFRAESVFRCDYKASKLVEPNRDEARAPSGNSSARRGLYICVGAGSQGTVRWDTDGASVMRRAFVRDKTMPGAPRCDEKFPEPGHRF